MLQYIGLMFELHKTKTIISMVQSGKFLGVDEPNPL